MHTIHFKFLFCLALLLILVLALALVGYSALSFYRNAVRDIGGRLETLPLALDITAEIEELRLAFDKIDFFYQQRTVKQLLFETELIELTNYQLFGYGLKGTDLPAGDLTFWRPKSVRKTSPASYSGRRAIFQRFRRL